LFQFNIQNLRGQMNQPAIDSAKTQKRKWEPEVRHPDDYQNRKQTLLRLTSPP